MRARIHTHTRIQIFDAIITLNKILFGFGKSSGKLSQKE